VRYKVTVTEVLPVTGSQVAGETTDGQVIFQTAVDFRPNMVKIIAALTPPRIRKPRSAKA
jgi:hypothetical protein